MSERIDPGRAPDELELVSFADGRLDADCARGREIATWLQSQPQARRRVDDYIRQDREIRAAFVSKLGEAVPVRLQLPSLRQRRRRWRRRQAGAVAAGAAVAALMLTMPPAQRGPAGTLDDFARDVLQQVEAGAAPAQAATALARTPPVFLPDGFELAGERRLDTASGPMTEQVYRDAAGRRLRVFIGEERRERAAEPQWLQAGGRHIVYWESGDRRYALSGEIGRPELQQLAAQAQAVPAPDDRLQLAGDAIPATTVDAAAVNAGDAMTPMPQAAQPASTSPGIGVDPLGQIDPLAEAEQPLL